MGDDPTMSFRSSLSIDQEDNDDNPGNDSDTVPLRSKILSVVKSSSSPSSPGYTIRPARLSQELGISVTDASAELCGLLKAVGEGSTFRFEKTAGGNDGGGSFVHTMVFTFPPDFERRALSAQSADDWKQTLRNGVKVSIKFLKILTAFGLILSTIIVSIAGMLALVAAFVAVSRGGDRRQQHAISRQLHDIFLMIRQLLWCYAMFAPAGGGGEGSDQQDPFFREAAYDTSLVLGICCGNPMSMWFWLRASHLRQRRRRIARGWGRINSSFYDDFGDSSSAGDLEGVRLIRRGAWGQEETLPVPSARNSDDHKGLLSLAVEFLFGSEQTPGPREADRWRLRSTVLLEKSQLSESPSSSIAIRDLCPYLDSPPASLDDTAKIAAEGLLVVTHFNGIPAADSSSTKANGPEGAHESDVNPAQARFVFPELLAESTVSMSRYDDPDLIYHASSFLDHHQSRWSGLFYQQDSSPNNATPTPSTTTTRTGGLSSAGNSSTPSFLYEQPMTFTALNAKDFYRCLLVAILNAVGVIWFAQSLVVGGILEQFLAPGVVQGLLWGLIPVLSFYAKLFFAIPTIRLIYILIWNEACRTRNRRRSHLAAVLASLKQQPHQTQDPLTAEK